MGLAGVRGHDAPPNLLNGVGFAQRVASPEQP